VVVQGGYDFVADSLSKELNVDGYFMKYDIKRRIEEASKFVDIDQLCLSPQCGFSSTLEGNSLSRDQQIVKLRRLDATGHGQPTARPAGRRSCQMCCLP
jgi:5-methyltetrahydropteroyltriglutamate--homocysteine methyltransferase